MHNLRSRLGLVVTGASISVLAMVAPAFAAVDSTAVTSGTGALTNGTDTLSALIYAAIPILLVVAVASIVARWIFRKMGSVAR